MFSPKLESLGVRPLEASDASDLHALADWVNRNTSLGYWLGFREEARVGDAP